MDPPSPELVGWRMKEISNSFNLLFKVGDVTIETLRGFTAS